MSVFRTRTVQNLFEVVYEDQDLLVINKPAGLVCHPTKTDEYSSLISRARLYLGPAIRPHLINRLDRETSGITLVAKEESVARRLRKLWELRAVTKEYLAIVHGQPREDHGIVDAPLGKDERSPVAIKDCVRPDGAAARTEFWRLNVFRRQLADGGYGSAARPKDGFRDGVERGPEISQKAESATFSLLRVVPHTGRKHQIRIHLAHLGHPIVGDKLYGEDEGLYLALVEGRLTAEQSRRLMLPFHALHAAALRFVWDGTERVFEADPDEQFKAFCSVPDQCA